MLNIHLLKLVEHSFGHNFRHKYKNSTNNSPIPSKHEPFTQFPQILCFFFCLFFKKAQLLVVSLLLSMLGHSASYIMVTSSTSLWPAVGSHPPSQDCVSRPVHLPHAFSIKTEDEPGLFCQRELWYETQIPWWPLSGCAGKHTWLCAQDRAQLQKEAVWERVAICAYCNRS